mmetsp:Transcript_10543/g.19673  ORF Transcript_10543/g.19673 Transcript_10543/m.19673 type:complete len:228 (+) Transcript_10543:109-792(+)
MSKVTNMRLVLQEELAKSTKMGDFKKIQQCLRQATFLSAVRLDPISSVQVKNAERKANSECAVINGVSTVAESSFYGTLRLLQDLSVQLCQMHHLNLDPSAVYENIVCRISRTVASADAYSKLKRIIKASNLSLIRTEDAAMRNVPSTVDMFESGGQLHANVSTTVSFGLVRNAELLYGKGDINQHGFLVNQRKSEPIEVWVKFDVVVMEKMNFSTGEYLRFATVLC